MTARPARDGGRERGKVDATIARLVPRRSHARADRCGPPGAQAPAASAAAAVDFATDIRPLLEAKCLGCHGEKLKLSKLDLRTRESAIEGGAHGPSLVPGSAEQSRIYRHVAGLESPAMPMRGEALSAGRGRHAEALDRRRRALGRRRSTAARRAAPAVAAIEERPITDEERGYWAFKPPVQAPLPGVSPAISTIPSTASSSRHAPAAGSPPHPRADRRTLVRRAYLDLLGLPPSPAEVDAFVADTRPDAWERLIDTLLASPHYGERCGRHWLDVVRYADSRRLRVRRPPPERLALPRLRHPGVQRRQALRPVPRRADRRRRDRRQDRRQPDRHRLPARRPAGAVPREGQPRATIRLPRRRHRRDRQGHAGADDRLRALSRPQVRSDPAEGLLRAAGVDLRLRRDQRAAGAGAAGRRLPGHQRGARRPARRTAARRSPPSRSRTATVSSWR